MSLAIDVDSISVVLLADGWHDVKDKSFTLDSYEYLWYPSAEAHERGEFEIMHGGGQSGVCATGFSFKEQGIISGPLTAILAVRHGESKR
jgi:hypothetical protein